MAKVEVKNLKNEVVDKIDLSDLVFAYAASESLVWEAVNAYLAGQRKGTHSTKRRSEVRGGGRKLWRQKGTGRARTGSSRSPLWRGGGVTFGPQPRDYSQPFPKKKRRGAVKMVLSDKLKDERLLVIEDFELASHRTQEFVGLMKTFGLEKKILVVDARENRNLFLSTRNLPGIKMVQPIGLNIYDLLNCGHLMISKGSLLELQEVLLR
jgi:large subunit ribosomal protein L4